MFVPMLTVPALALACCAGPDERDPAGLVIPASILVFGLTGAVLLFVSLSWATRAIDVASWTISPVRLASARTFSLIAAGFLTAAVVGPLGGLLLLSTLAPAFFFGPLASLLLLAPTSLAWIYARLYRKLIDWHRTAPPEALRPPMYGWPGPYQTSGPAHGGPVPGQPTQPPGTTPGQVYPPYPASPVLPPYQQPPSNPGSDVTGPGQDGPSPWQRPG